MGRKNELLKEDLEDCIVYYNKDILFVPHYSLKGMFVAPGNKVFHESDLQGLPKKKLMLWKRK